MFFHENLLLQIITKQQAKNLCTKSNTGRVKIIYDMSHNISNVGQILWFNHQGWTHNKGTLLLYPTIISIFLHTVTEISFLSRLHKQ